VGAVVTADPEPRESRVARALPLVLAALLAVAALGTVGSAGCDDPGYYVSTPDGVALVGGCLAPGDLDPLDAHPDAQDPMARRG
jgi:hypothetical protein